MLTEYNIKQHYDSKHADSVYGNLKGRNQELKVDLFKCTMDNAQCIAYCGPQYRRAGFVVLIAIWSAIKKVCTPLLYGFKAKILGLVK